MRQAIRMAKDGHRRTKSMGGLRQIDRSRFEPLSFSDPTLARRFLRREPRISRLAPAFVANHSSG